MFFGQTKGARRLSNTLRRVGALVIAILFTMLLTVVTWGQTLDKGIYTISNNVSHDNPVGQGMARSYTEETSDVEVNDSGIFVTLGFNNTQYMGDFAISVGGSKVTYETTTHANNIKKLKFKVPSLSSNIKVGLYVTAMDTNVEYTVTLNESSLKLIKKAETAPQENTSSTTTSTSHTAGSGTSGNNTVTNSGTTNNGATSNTGSSTNSTTTTNKGTASIAISNNNTSSVQGSSASKNNAQATTNKVTTEQATSSEAAPKNEVKAEKAEVAKTETVKEEAQQVDTEAASQDETKVEVKDEAKVEADSTRQDAVEAKTDAEVESEVEGQVENKEEVTEEQAEEDGIIEVEESEEAVISSGNNLGMILIICGIAVGAIIGVVIYLKRK